MENLKITHLVLEGENLSAKLVCQLLEKVNKHSWAKIIAFYQVKFVKDCWSTEEDCWSTEEVTQKLQPVFR